jgi:hypothetical protein
MIFAFVEQWGKSWFLGSKQSGFGECNFLAIVQPLFALFKIASVIDVDEMTDQKLWAYQVWADSCGA